MRRQQSAITPGIHAIKVSSGELLTHWTWEHVHMSVVGVAMSDYVEPDATDQGSLSKQHQSKTPQMSISKSILIVFMCLDII